MKIKLGLLLLLFAFLSFTALADQIKLPLEFNTKAQAILLDHYNKYKEMEYFSGATLSIYIPKNHIQTYYIGNVSHHPESEKIDSKTLFQIGSITKSFTAVVMLQLEKENKLALSDTIDSLLPNYSKWSSITLMQLLNMTSGLPNYSDSPLWNAEIFKNPRRTWTSEALIKFVYPRELSPPLKKSYFYTNTGYLLAEMIAERATKESFKTLLTEKTIKKAGLENTFYPVPLMEYQIMSRMASGYNYNQYDNPSLVGKNLKDNNLSWAAAAGGIVANSEDIIRWVKALFVGDEILDINQKKKLKQLISVQTGKPLKQVSQKEPRGFGLGVIEAYDPEMGAYWFYEGETLGFRALYFYKPCNGVIISSIFNSATNQENDHAGELMKKAYALVLKQYPALNCKTE